MEKKDGIRRGNTKCRDLVAKGLSRTEKNQCDLKGGKDEELRGVQGRLCMA